jgi:2-keto-4-pentenoate hydratase/2-oxohepta-3-ene-1,7-dioic acid hydratase in catechol pathway
VRLATIRSGAGPLPALVRNGMVTPLEDGPKSVNEIIAAGLGLWRELEGRSGSPDAQPLEEVQLDVPLRPERFIFTIGANYAAPGKDPRPSADAPLVFGKLPGAAIGPGGTLSWDPAVLPLVDYEVELAIIIGQQGYGIAEEAAWSHVFGYTCLNDIASREPRYDGDQWLLGKSHPSFCPIGPWIVTVDEVPDPYTLAMRSRLNGEVVQSGSTAQMRFRIPQIVAYLSRFTELRPGDVIATGTPPGTGIDRQPPRLLRDGDEITIEIDGIGSLGNRVVLNP